VDILGKGLFGEIFKCFDENNNNFAIKIIKNNDTSV